ncbi:hypothetical protein E2C01_095308 [Portunus trituberculatus]|uniref:Uncharacterized protein n=1 Tax=Portunus trituberculatus TaxID=210409 RepID=A0A5B7JZ28_PORTR|nr:hypothetical protein [Portunus trituberculatus]
MRPSLSLLLLFLLLLLHPPALHYHAPTTTSVMRERMTRWRGEETGGASLASLRADA